jgi:HEAT repeat protein
MTQKQTLEQLIASLSHADLDEKLAAIKAIKLLKNARVVPILINALSSENNPLVKMELLGALAEIGDEQAIEPIIRQWEADNHKVYNKAVGSLRKEWDSISKPILLRILENKAESPKLRSRVAWSLKNSTELTDIFLRIARDDLDEILVRSMCIEILGKSKNKSISQELYKFLNDSHPELRAAAALALGRLKEQAGYNDILLLLKDRQASVRKAAIQALDMLGNSSSASPLMSMLDDVDVDVRANAALALGRLGAVQAIEKLKRNYENALHELKVTRNVLRELNERNID